MKRKKMNVCLLLLLFLQVFFLAPAQAGTVDLRLVPFPKQVEGQSGQFSLDQQLTLETNSSSRCVLSERVSKELRRAGLPVPQVTTLEDASYPMLRLSAQPGQALPETAFQENESSEYYLLQVNTSSVLVAGKSEAGLLHGVQTLCQLMRANLQGKSLACLTIHDWPSLRWRCFQDDLTRGPSSTLATLKQHVDLGSELKMNLLTYYMEYQFAFKKHPTIGPKNGSLVREDLAALVDYAKTHHMDILGNQQSFGHYGRILAKPEYAHLQETPAILCPVKDETYALLDDFYSELCPVLPFPWLNVCCDETWGLGKGPSKALAEKIGVGGVYVQHIRRVYDLLKEKHNKRMMMWGDIILQHPDKLDQIPQDTIMLTWGYAAKASFEDQIKPFANSGYEFFVCPGISNWRRIMPDFGVAETNIRNFVRDGHKHGTLGMLNTAWEDDGENVQGYKWHGYAWGAECAWNASTTEPDDFNRRIGAVLFGEKDDHFGQALVLLSKTHRLPGMQGMINKRFWQDDFKPQGEDAAERRKEAEQLLAVVRPAIEHLLACQQDAIVNVALLDAFLQGSRRMELIGQRILDAQTIDHLWKQAAKLDTRDALSLLARIESIVCKNRRAYQALGEEFQRQWLAESKPYALNWTMKRYKNMDNIFNLILDHLAEARHTIKAGAALPASWRAK